SALLLSSSRCVGLPVPWVCLFGVLPSSRRPLLTVRAAISCARSSECPRFSELSLMCSYLRRSLSVQDGMTHLLALFQAWYPVYRRSARDPSAAVRPLRYGLDTNSGRLHAPVNPVT